MNHESRIMNYGLKRLICILIFLILYSLFLITRSAQAQVIATGVEQHRWTIDNATARSGVTLSNRGERVKVGIASGAVQAGTAIEMMTYASTYYVEGNGVHRVTPIYRVVIGALNGAEFPVEIRHHGEDLGKKSVRVWGDDDIWREIPSQSAPERNAVRAKISTGTTYFAVFSDNRALEIGNASWYNYKNCHCAASPDYPRGTKLLVTNVQNGKSVEVKVNDFGPDRSVHPDRVIDLDLAAFEHLASPRSGIVRVKVSTL